MKSKVLHTLKHCIELPIDIIMHIVGWRGWGGGKKGGGGGLYEINVNLVIPSLKEGGK